MVTRSPNRYEPAARAGHLSLLVDGSVYLWGGGMDGIPEVHDSPEKREFLSSVDVFQLDCRDWIRRETSGTPPLGVKGYCCAAVSRSLYYFGGYCGHDKCCHNSVHELSTSSLQWMMQSPSTSESGAPMRKSGSGMVAFRDGEEDILCVVAGFGPTPSHPGAQYEAADGSTMCNEQHMFSLTTTLTWPPAEEWSSPRITGQPPPLCHDFILIPVGETRAALFGGDTGSGGKSDDLLIVELTKHTVHWTKINKPVNRSVEWPTKRCGHAAACVSGPLLVIVGGISDKLSAISDCWIHDLTAMKWKKLSLPETVTKRIWHSLSAIQLSPHNVLLVVVSGCRLQFSDAVSDNVLIELIQGGDGQWVVGRIEGKREYQQMPDGRWWVEDCCDQLLEQQLQLVKARVVVQRLMTELLQLTGEKELVTRDKEQVIRAKELVTREKELVTGEKEQVTREKELVTREKEQVTREKEQVTREKEQVTREKEQVTREKEQVTREKEQREQQLMRHLQQLTKENEQLVREKDQAVREKDQAVREKDQAAVRAPRPSKARKKATSSRIMNKLHVIKFPEDLWSSLAQGLMLGGQIERLQRETILYPTNQSKLNNIISTLTARVEEEKIWEMLVQAIHDSGQKVLAKKLARDPEVDVPPVDDDD